MPLSDHLPLDRSPAPFDPSRLARSVIALPLLERIRAEVKTREKFERDFPTLLAGYNAAVFLRHDHPEGAAGARKRARELLDKALKESGAAGKYVIDEPLPELGGWVCLARLDDDLARLLRGLDRAETTVEEPAAIEGIWPTLHNIIIEVNLGFVALDAVVADGLPKKETERLARPLDARKVAKALIARFVEKAKSRKAAGESDDTAHRRELQGVDETKTELTNQYVFACLDGSAVQRLVEIDNEWATEMAEQEARRRNEEAAERTAAGSKARPSKRAKTAEGAEKAGVAAPLPVEPQDLVAGFRTIYHIWPDFEIASCITRSISTVKADAAQRSFSALGEGITWAVMDSGIQGDHPHFIAHKNIDPNPTRHGDFTGPAPGAGSPLTDEFGHGTHVAGIIAGEQSPATNAQPATLQAVFRELDQGGAAQRKTITLTAIAGMAPKCQLVSLKVLDQFGQGRVSNLIAAIGHIQQINGHGRELHIHGVNISLGYPFDPKWFACGRSPICVEVNRLVKSGVVVVVAAGNTGYGTLQTKEGESDACLDLTINDPGNAECAITVGSTHRDMPHVYGVSFFSSKGPTGDGRFKPDLLAPGEKIISCATGKLREKNAPGGGSTVPPVSYLETSGTSMAAPHVSGVVAAFLSIRREFIGESERVKQVFTSTATDLQRDRYFQGAGLVDLMRAIQSV